MQINQKTMLRTHEGAPAKNISHEQILRRSVMACMLWEDQFYESGIDIAKRIIDECNNVSDEVISNIAIEAREKQKLRHVPLLLARILAKKGSKLTAETLNRIIQRPDELSEFLAIYWKDGREPLSKQVKKGLAKAFIKFNEYQLAKYNREGAIKLRDVLFLCHAKPENEQQDELWKRLINNQLDIPDTWEVALSGGADKKETFTRLMSENKLGALAFLRNLRNMIQSGVEVETVREYISRINTSRVLPFRFINAVKYAPMLEPEIEQLMIKCLDGAETLSGVTVILVDVSGSMKGQVSAKSDLTRLDAATALSILSREVCENVRIYSFSDNVVEIPPRRGFALSDAIVKSQKHSGTYLGRAIFAINNSVQYDRIIVITDEQSHDSIPNPKSEKAYMINVSSYRNGVGYGAWTNISGWSESIIDYIQQFEKAS